MATQRSPRISREMLRPPSPSALTKMLRECRNAAELCPPSQPNNDVLRSDSNNSKTHGKL